jgi:hypothetical protein
VIIIMDRTKKTLQSLLVSRGLYNIVIYYYAREIIIYVCNFETNAGELPALHTY